MKTTNRIWACGAAFLVLVFCLCTSSSSCAQTATGQISGTVVDPQGAVVPNATVTILNKAQGVTRTAQTNSSGFYTAPFLAVGLYRLAVQASGFQTAVTDNVELHVGDLASINFTLKVGSATETVTVEGGAPLLNTADASVSTVVDQTYVKNMPLNGRSFQDLILLTPGVVTQIPQISQFGATGLGQTGEFSVNGQRMESNYYTVDGVSANVGAAAGGSMLVAGASGSVAASTALGTTQALVSVDALQEFRVQSSSYSAEYGRNPGGQFAFETKSGTNQWHGTAYDYLRNDLFDATDYFTNYFRSTNPLLKKTALRQNDFGGTLGGPVRIPSLYNGKDKTFFFVSYEGLRLTAPQPVKSILVPSLCLRGRTANCTGGETPAPSALQPVLNAFPVPNIPEILTTGAALFVGTWSDPSSVDSTSVRFDHVVSDKLRLFFRFSDTPSSSAIRAGSSPGVRTTFAYALRTYTGGASSIFTSRLSNEVRLNYSSNLAKSRDVIDAFGGNTPVDLFQLTGLGPGAGALVLMVLNGNSIALTQSQSSGAQRQWNLVDTVSLSLGRHQFKFGVDYRRLAPFGTPINPFVAYLYYSKSNVDNNNPSLTEVDTNTSKYPLYTNFSAFAQDQWRASRRLSLSLGLRWDVNPAPGVTQGLKPYTIQGSGPDTWTLAPQGTPLWRTTWDNFAPRFGAAYILHNTPGRETVARGGFGAFFDTGQQLGSRSFSGPGFQASVFPSGPFPGSPAKQAPTIINPPVPPYSPPPFGFASHLELPYTLQWNGSLEQALGKSQALTVSYVGSHASKLLKQNTFSSSVNPVSSSFVFYQNGLTSDYNSAQVQFRRRLSRGLTALGSFTWSHCIDYGSEDYSTGYQRGNCDFDVRSNLSAAFSYDLPDVGNNGFVNAVLHHWGLDNRFTARTGFPVTLRGTPGFDPATHQSIYKGLDLVPGQPIYIYDADCANVYKAKFNSNLGCPGRRAINPNAFTNNLAGLIGVAPRNFARGFGAWQLDMAVRRDFPIVEGLRLQFRAEAFNIFNHPNFGRIDSSFGSSTFGQAKGTLASSSSVLSPLYQQGGSRSMQFALKIIF